MSGELEIQSLSKKYQSSTAVRDFDLRVEPGEFITLLGSSGSGKTTTLLMIAGFEDATSGSLILDGKDITRVPPNKRGIGMMFQHYSLFPHMTVHENVAYPLKLRKVPRSELRQRVADALELVRLSDFAGRYPAELSGGQQQRVALARAVVFEPGLLPMDEPLSALDRGLRKSMQGEIRRIHRNLKTTIIYVTHDQDEALSMSDRIVLMHEGDIMQVGTPAELYDSPANTFVADFVGESTLLGGTVESSSGDSYRIKLASGELVDCASAQQFAAGDAVVVRVRPQHLVLADAGSEGAGAASVNARVEDSAYLGDFWQHTARSAAGVSMLFQENCGGSQVQIGQDVRLSWDPDDAILLRA